MWYYNKDVSGYSGLIEGTHLLLRCKCISPPVNYVRIGAVMCCINVLDLPIPSENLFYSDSSVNPAIIYMRP